MDPVKKRDGKIGPVLQTTSSPYSAVFKATFANGWVETDLMSDQGADASFLAEDLIAQILRETPNAKMVRFKTEHIHRGETGEPCLTCSKKVTLDVYLKIGHGSCLVLRNVD